MSSSTENSAWPRWRAAALSWQGWLILLAIAGPWYALALDRHGQAFVQGFLIRHNVARYTSVLEGHTGSLGYYLMMLPLLMLPWGVLLPWLVARSRRWWAVPCERYLLIWLVFVLSFFTFSGTKLPHYVLYGCTPVFLLTARLLQTSPRLAAWAQAAAVAMIGLYVVLPWIAQYAGERVPDALYRALLREPLIGSAGVLIAVAIAVLGWIGVRTATRDGTLRAAGTALAAALALVGGVVPWIGEQLQGPIRRAGLAARTDEPVVQWDVRWSSASVVRERPTPKRPPRVGELALVRFDKLALEAKPEQYQVVFAERGVGLVRWMGP